MLRQLPAAIAACLCIGIVDAADPTPSLDWIGGHWCLETGNETVEELWLPPRGGVAIGLSRTVTNGAITAFEYLRIVDLDGTPAYIAQPGGNPPTTFRMVAAGEGWVRFENPAHDFPRRIEYRRDGDGLHAEITGPGEGGDETAIAFDYRPCGA